MSNKKLFKVILAWVLGLSILVYTGTGMYKWWDLQNEEVYSLKIVDKWASSTYYKSSFSNNLYLKGCLVSDPERCSKFTVRQSTYESTAVGDITSFEFRKQEFYSGVHDMLGFIFGFIFGFAFLLIGGFAFAFVIWFCIWLFDYE